MSNTVAIVQARMGSTRLPRKVMRKIHGTPVIDILLTRLSRAKTLDRILVATSDRPENAEFAEHVRALGFDVYVGSEHDVLDRYHQAAAWTDAQTIVRVTGDCPLIDPEIVDRVVNEFKRAQVGYASNVLPPTFPDGLCVEVFSRSALATAWQEATRPFDREHVTSYLIDSPLVTKANVSNDVDHSSERWTIDEAPDLEVVEQIIGYFKPRLDFSWHEVIDLKRREPARFVANSAIARNEGATQSSGAKLWRKAKRLIPGGGMLLSKRAELYLPELWPAYFQKAKDCRVWDLDGVEYVDMSIMGIGTNTLGYGHPEVDAAVFKAISDGNMSTLNCPEEVHLAERLTEIHPWANMVRFARTGGEANAIAIRIARAASGKDKVAFCGYHGWHDWYLAANLGGDDSLGDHLLPGLKAKGVPRGLAGTSFPFSYNDFDALEGLSVRHDLGVIIMEVVRNFMPEPGFLEKVRELATRKGIVLIFDECTSGFRQTFGGIHKMFGVEPDMAMLGKALGNGYAINAVIGRRDVMEAAQSTFVSSTFWTERIGAAAALKTLEVMEREASYDQITNTGRVIAREWQSLADRHSLRIKLSGLPALIGFEFESKNSTAYKTLMTQEMLQRGYLAIPSVYVCTEHTPEIVARYVEALDPVFELIAECEAGRPVEELLKGPICQTGFQRLN